MFFNKVNYLVYVDLFLLWQRLCVRRWSESGVSVKVLTQDASTLAGAKALLSEAAQDGDIGGIFHLAVVSNVSFISIYFAFLTLMFFA